MACGGGGDRRALGRCSGAYPVAQTTLDMPRTHLRNGDIPGAQRQGVRTHQHTRQTPCTHKPGCDTEQRGGIALHGGPTRRRHAVRRLHVVQNPHHFRLVGRRIAYKTGHNVSWREKTCPARPPQRHLREKTRPASTKTPNLGCCERAGRTFSRPARQLREIKTFKAMTTHSHCPRETADTNARLPELTNETAITIVSPQHPKNRHFLRAKVSPVSSQHSLGPAKVSPVSSRRSSALDTAPMHQIAQHCTGN